MDLPGTECGSSMKILHLYIPLIPMESHILTCFLNHQKMTLRFGHISMDLFFEIPSKNNFEKQLEIYQILWPYFRWNFLFSFEFRLRVALAVDGHLTLISRIRNVNCKPFSFSFAYHTYFSVSDIRYYITFLVTFEKVILMSLYCMMSRI